VPQLSRHLLVPYVRTARRLLIDAATDHRLMPYAELIRELGTSRGYIGQILDAMNEEEHAKGCPFLSALVVQADTGRASAGFYDLLRRLRPETIGRDERTLWEEECAAVWAYPWKYSG